MKLHTHTAMRRTFLLLVALSLTLSGCAGDGHRSDSESQVVSIDYRVAMPKRVHYVSAGQQWGNSIASLGGAVPALIGMAIASSSESTDPLEDYFAQKRIDVGQIFAGEMRQALQQSGFQVIDNGAGNQLRLHVLEYGFHSAESFGGKMHLMMNVEAQLYDPAGKRIWSKKSGSQHVKQPARQMQEFLGDPTGLAESFRVISADMAQRLQSDLGHSQAWLVGAPRTYVARAPEPHAVAAPEYRDSGYNSTAAAQSPPTYAEPASPVPPQRGASSATYTYETTSAIGTQQPVSSVAPANAEVIAHAASGGTRYRPRSAPESADSTAATTEVRADPAVLKVLPQSATPTHASKAGDPAHSAMTRGGASVRKRPTPDGPVMQMLAAGTPIQVTTQLQNKSDTWWYVTSPVDGGWISGNDLQMR